MPTDVLIVKASVLEGFDRFLADRGGVLAPLLSEAGLTPNDLADPYADVPLNAVTALMERAAERVGDPCLGLAWAEAFPTGGLRTLAYIALNARTVREALYSIARYIGLLTYPVEMEFHEEVNHGVIFWCWPPSLVAPHVQYSSFLVTLLVIRMRRASQGAAEPLLVELAHRKLDCPERVLRMLGSRVDYNAQRYAVHYDARTLDRRFAESDPRLLSIVKPIGEKMLEELPQRGDLIVETRRTIVARLESGEVTLDSIASELDISPRTLQTRLADAGTTYDALLGETRQTMAERYLRDKDLTLTHIAFLLGYSELSAFTRAAQRWFGVPPSAYREKLRGN